MTEARQLPPDRKRAKREGWRQAKRKYRALLEAGGKVLTLRIKDKKSVSPDGFSGSS